MRERGALSNLRHIVLGKHRADVGAGWCRPSTLSGDLTRLHLTLWVVMMMVPAFVKPSRCLAPIVLYSVRRRLNGGERPPRALPLLMSLGFLALTAELGLMTMALALLELVVLVSMRFAIANPILVVVVAVALVMLVVVAPLACLLADQTSYRSTNCTTEPVEPALVAAMLALRIVRACHRSPVARAAIVIFSLVRQVATVLAARPMMAPPRSLLVSLLMPLALPLAWFAPMRWRRWQWVAMPVLHVLVLRMMFTCLLFMVGILILLAVVMLVRVLMLYAGTPRMYMAFVSGREAWFVLIVVVRLAVLALVMVIILVVVIILVMVVHSRWWCVVVMVMFVRLVLVWVVVVRVVRVRRLWMVPMWAVMMRGE